MASRARDGASGLGLAAPPGEWGWGVEGDSRGLVPVWFGACRKAGRGNDGHWRRGFPEAATRAANPGIPGTLLRRAEKEAAALTASLNRKGKIWLGCATAVVVAYVIFGGQYFSIGYFDDEDIEDEDDE